MLFVSLGNKKGLGLDLLLELKNNAVISRDFSKDKGIRTETLKPYQDKLEELDLIKVEVMRKVKGRPNRIEITPKGKDIIKQIEIIQRLLCNEDL